MKGSGLFTIRDVLFYGGQDPDHTAIESPGCPPVTYRDLRYQVSSLVTSLNARGFHRNDRIALITPPGPETAALLVSVMAGFTAVPFNPQCTAEEYRKFFSQTGIRAVIARKDGPGEALAVAAAGTIPVIEWIPVPREDGIYALIPPGAPGSGPAEYAEDSDFAYVLQTSGTTAKAKIVPVTQRRLCHNKDTVHRLIHITKNDRCLHILPFYHGMGLGSALISTLIAGGTVICPRDFIPSDFPELLKITRPTWYAAGPALQKAILKEVRKLSPEDRTSHSLRIIRSTSGFLPEQVRLELEGLLNVPVIESYGMSEALTITMNIPPKPGSVGLPVTDSLRIGDENGCTLPAGHTGEILIRGISVFPGYDNAPDENRAAFLDGWFRTGDLGYLDCDGYLYLTGRTKDLINKGGEKIAPAEIDSALLLYCGVSDAMSFPVRDPILGEDIAAMVVRNRDSVSEKDLRDFLLDRLQPAKIPRKIYFVGSIPKNAAGKPLRHEGTRMYGGQEQKLSG